MDLVKAWQIEGGQPFASLVVDSWPEFLKVVDTYFLDWPEYIYRGHRECTWPLRSQFDRWLVRATESLKAFDPLEGVCAEDWFLVEEKSVRSLDARADLLRRQLERFKSACCGRRGVNPPTLSDDEWWALGRHFGLATPLLDWARSPYVACFFAVEDEMTSSSGMRAVWAFSALAAQEIMINQPENQDRPMEEVIDQIAVLDLPVDENSRSLSQGGLFTRTADGKDLDIAIGENVDLVGSAPVLYRIDIPDNLREEFLRQLEAMNIHAGSLFPDLFGAAQVSNRGLEKEYTAISWELRPDFTRRMLATGVSHDASFRQRDQQ